MRCVSLGIAVTVMAVGLRGQSGCPAVNFLLPADLPLNTTPSIGAGMERKADASYTLHRWRTSAPYAKVDTTPNFAAALVACTGYPRRPLQVPAGWRPGGDQQLGVSSNNPVAADLTGNGLLSAIVINESSPANGVWVARPNADYTVRDMLGYTVGVRPITALAADFNGDGKRDIAVFTSGSTTVNGSVSILINNGDGTFRPVVNYPAGTSPGTGTAQDFNGDGKLDLAVGDSNAGLITILLGNGDGTFRAGASIPSPQSTFNILAIAAADLNADSKQDLVAAGGDTIVFVLGNGDGTFKTPTTVALGGGLAYQVATGDFNKDGKLDVVTVDSRSSTARVMLGAGDGTFPTSASYLMGATPNAVMVTDFDFDGNLDIVAGTGHPDGLTHFFWDTDVTVLFGNGDGTFYGAKTTTIPTDISGFASADFNRDGRPDIAVASPFGNGGIQVSLGQANGGFQNVPIPAAGSSIVAGDFNGDGNPDLASAAGSSSLTLVLGNGNGTFRAPATVPIGNPGNSVDAGDLNADGKTDLVIASGSYLSTSGPNVVTLLVGNGNGTFRSPVALPVLSNPVDAKLADFNGDGKLDMVVVHGATRDNAGNLHNGAGISVMLGKGDGTFQSPAVLTAGVNPVRAFIADVNRDGKPDILVPTGDPNAGSWQIAVFLGAGNGTFAPGTFLSTDFGPTWIAVADFNNDGKADLLITHCCGDTVTSYMLGNGDGTFQPEVFLAGPPSGAGVLAADFNGDGKMDAAVATDAGFLTVLTNISSVALPAPGGSTPAAGSGASGVFNFTFTDPRGFQDLGVVNILVNYFLDGRSACYLAYSRPANVLYLVSNDGGSLLPGQVLNSSGSTSNSQCTVSWGNSPVSGVGNTLTLTLTIAFSASFGGNKVIYLAARDAVENSSGWQALGVWQAPGSVSSTNTAVAGMSPARGSGLGPATFTFNFSDTKGFLDLGVENILINNFLDGRHACYLAYARSIDVLYLVNDNGDALLPGQAVSAGGSLSNSQCSVSWGAGAANGSGNNLALTLNIAFSASFGGNRVFYLADRDVNESNNSNWQPMGSWTVQ